MKRFVQGDNAVVIPFSANGDDLTDAVVKVAIRNGDKTITKDATIVYAPKGKCQFTLYSTDLTAIGKYNYQWTVFFSDGRFYSGQIREFEVSELMVSIPPSQDNPEPLILPFATREELEALETRVDNLIISGGGTVIKDSTINGNILVDNVEIQVYDESPLSQRVADLETSGVGGGSNVTDSTTNGNIVVDGNEIKVYDDSSIVQSLSNKANSTDLHSHTNKSTLDKLTDDGTNLLFNGSTISGGSGSTHDHANKTILDQITAAFTTELKTKLEALNGILVYATVTDLQNAYPDGTDQPVWITVDKSWYYWDGDVTEPTDATPPTVTASPSSGTYTSQQTVTLSANETADIYYTLDGSTPTTSSTKYVSAITISSTTTLKFFGRDTAGNQSSVQTITYTINLPDTTAPNDVTGLTLGSPTETTIPVSWTLSDSTDVANYEVAYSSNGGTSWTVASNVINASSTSYTITGLQPNTQYTVRVVAIDTSSNRSTGVISNPVTTLVATDTTPPAIPTGLTATSGDTSISLDWTDNADSDLSGYNVYQSTDNVNFSKVNTTLISVSSYNVTGLVNGSIYYFKVSAVDTSANESSQTASVSATPVAPVDTTPPADVTNLTVTETTENSITVTWNHPNPSDVESYEVTIEEII